MTVLLLLSTHVIGVIDHAEPPGPSPKRSIDPRTVLTLETAMKGLSRVAVIVTALVLVAPAGCAPQWKDDGQGTAEGAANLTVPLRNDGGKGTVEVPASITVPLWNAGQERSTERRPHGQDGTTLAPQKQPVVGTESESKPPSRTWSDSTGKYTTEAQFVEFKDGKVQLRKRDGTVVFLPVERLSQADKDYVNDLIKAQHQQRDGAGTEAQPDTTSDAADNLPPLFTEKTVLPYKGMLECVAISADGRFLAGGGFAGKANGQGVAGIVRLWELPGRRELRVFLDQEPGAFKVYRVAIAPDNKVLIGGAWNIEDKSNAVIIWDMDSGKEIARLKGHREAILSIALAPDGKTLASADSHGVVKLWDMKTRKERASFQGNTYTVTSMDFSPDGKTLAVGGGARGVARVWLWDVQSGKEKGRLAEHKFQVDEVRYSPNGRTIAVARAFWIRMHDAITQKETMELTHYDQVESLAFSPDGTLLAVGGVGGSATLWDSATGKRRVRLFSLGSAPQRVAFSPDGKLLASTGTLGMILWDVPKALSYKQK